MGYKKITLSIIPTTYCENKCDYCYLGFLRENKTILPESRIHEVIEELLDNHYEIENLQFYGGDLESELFRPYRPDYFLEFGPDVSIVGKCGNAVTVNIERKDYEENMKRLSQYPREDALVVLLPETLSRGPQWLLDSFSKDWRGTLNVYQYQPAQLADKTYEMTNKDYCNYMIELIDLYLKGNYEFGLGVISELEDGRLGKAEGVFGSHVFLFPNGRLADVCYDEKGLEHFVFFESVKEWERHVNKQKRSLPNECYLCYYEDRCFAEHFKEWKTGDCCCGMLPLIEWWGNNYGRLNS